MFAALLKDGAARRIILNGSFVMPWHGVRKMLAYKQFICDKGGIDEDDFDETLSSLLSRIELVRQESFIQSVPLARSAMHHIDPEDVPFVALAIAKGLLIWSDDKHLQKQKIVRVLTTNQLIHTERRF